jgi:5'(3')-deoxyribonucleotidase
MIPKRLLLDSDGVLSGFIAGVVATVNRHRRAKGDLRTVYVADVDQYNFAAALKLTELERGDLWNAIAEPGWCAALPVLPGAESGVETLRGLREVFIVTKPWEDGPTWCHERTAWLASKLAIPRSRVVHTDAKYVVGGDMLVDDHVETLEAWHAQHPEGTPVLWRTPHNEHDRWSGVVVEDFHELIEYLRMRDAWDAVA